MKGLLFELITEVEASENLGYLHQEGLSNGMAGLAYYYYHLFKITQHRPFLDKSISYIERVLFLVGKEEQLITYYASNLAFGLSGLAFTINEFDQKNELLFSVRSMIRDIDDLIGQAMLQQLGYGHFSILFGFSGSLFYFNCKSDKAAVKMITDTLEQLLLQTGFRNFKSLEEYFTKTFRSATASLNFSFIHGLSGLFYVLLLIAIKHKNVDSKFNLKAVLHSFLSYLLENYLSDESQSNIFNVYRNKINAPPQRQQIFAAHLNDLYMLIFIKKYSMFYNDRSFKTTTDVLITKAIRNNSFIQQNLVEEIALVEATTITELLKKLLVYTDDPELWKTYQLMNAVIDKCIALRFKKETTWDQKLKLINGYPSVILNRASHFYPEKATSWSKVLML
ncbi:MAG: Lanthionine synthetase C-like protein [Mucilaginibacter sp.]|nr:Lanthionine synthetase C-like protein [Mucilaginibacter sp.]